MDEVTDNAISKTHHTFYRKWWFQVLLIFFLSRLALFAVMYLGAGEWPYEDRPGQWRNKDNSVVVDALTRWDAGWYMSITKRGYSMREGHKSNVAFFPLYPQTVRVISKTLGTNVPATAFALNNLLFLGALLIASRLAINLTGSENVAQITVSCLAFQPAMFFFSGGYSESMFLFTLGGCLLAASRKNWILAGIFGFLCSMTRHVGVCTAPAVGLMWLADNDVTPKMFFSRAGLKELVHLFTSRWSWLWTLFVPCGLLCYMAFLHFRFGNAIAFVDIQKEWGNQVIGFWNVLLPQLVRIFTLRSEWHQVMNVFFSLLYILLGILSWRKFGAGLGVISLALVLIPSSATTASMVRYVSVILPSFVVLSYYLDKYKVANAFISASALFASVFALFYSHWLFVA